MSLYDKELENLSEKQIEFSKQWFRKFAKTSPPYNFIINYSNIMKKHREDTPEGIFGRRFAQVLSMEIDKDINNELRLVELEKDLVPLVEQTDNKIFFRPLFFPSIFINNDFYFENLIVKGILITECYSESGTNKYALHHPDMNDYAVLIVAADIDQTCEFYSTFALLNKKIGDVYTDTKEENIKMNRLADYIRLLICNIIDMVEGNDEDLEIVTIESTREQNLKRIKRRQVPIPTKVFIKAKGKFKKYINGFAREINRPEHSFTVRGHWRHYRDPRFVNVKDTKIWIKPFIKGEGILIRKDIKIKCN